MSKVEGRESKVEETRQTLTEPASQPDLSAFSPPPSALKPVVVTRAREQSGELVEQLREFGLAVIEFPTIKFAAPDSFEAVDRALARLDSYDWLVFTSANSVPAFMGRLKAAGRAVTALDGIKVAAIGPATGRTAREHGLEVALTPRKYVLEGILEALGEARGQRFLIPAAEQTREALAEGLRRQGAEVEQVTVYRTVAAGDADGGLPAGRMLELLQGGQVGMVSFTSASTVHNFAARLAGVSQILPAELLRSVPAACIGPITAETARRYGLWVALEAAEFTARRLAEDIAGFFQTNRRI